MTTTAAAPRERFPSAVWFLAGNEAAERFSYYGMASILTLYMRDQLQLAPNVAASYYQWFVAAVYLMPILGGVLADRWWGRYRTILWISFGYVLGHGTLALFESPAGLVVGLALISLGAGGIKPNASAFAGDQIPPGNRSLLERLYNLWYWSINIGSTFGTALVPLLLPISPRLAFGVPGLAMALALAVFWAGRARYVRVPAQVARTRAEEERDAHEPPAEGAVLRIVAVFLPIVIFWALFFQYAGAWTLQADALDRVVFGLKLEAGQVTTLNALFVLTLIPVMAVYVYPAVERAGVKVTPLRKMVVGMFVSAASFAATAAVEAALQASPGAPPHVAWQVPQYLLMSVGEVLVSVTALEFAYTQAPRRMRSLVMGLWFLTMAAGSVVTAVVSRLNSFEGTSYYLFFTGLQLAAAVIFAAVAWWYPDARRDLPAAGAAA